MDIINPRRACTVRVTVVAVSVCLSVCVCVSVCKSHLTSGASVRCENAATYSGATKVKKIEVFSLKLLRCGDRALPPLMAIHTVSHFPADNTHVHCAYKSFSCVHDVKLRLHTVYKLSLCSI